MIDRSGEDVRRFYDSVQWTTDMLQEYMTSVEIDRNLQSIGLLAEALSDYMGWA